MSITIVRQPSWSIRFRDVFVQPLVLQNPENNHGSNATKNLHARLPEGHDKTVTSAFDSA